MNKIIIIGRICNDIDLRQTQSGVASCRFTVAVHRKFTNKDTGERETDFISCIAWRQTAEFVSRYFNKGKMIALEGSLRTTTYKDKKYPDVNHYATDVLVDSVEFCGDKSNATPPAQKVVQKAQAEGIDEYEVLLDEDTPF